MPRSCTICQHPQLTAINKALVDGAGLRDIAGRYNLSKSSVERHKNEHLPATMVKAKDRADVRHAIDIVQQLKAANTLAWEVATAARGHDPDTVLRALDRVLRQIELQAKLLGELQPEGSVNITISAEWVHVRAVLMNALSAYLDARAAVAQALLEVEA